MTLPEFSRLFEWADANERPAEQSLTASPEEMAGLARRFGLPGLDDMHANLTIAPHSLGFLIEGSVCAKVEQRCAISNAPIISQVQAPISYLAISEDADIDLETVEEAFGVAEAERVEASGIDLGELAAQYLGLAIDPFPRAPGAALDSRHAGEKQNPFAVLAKLKDKA